MMEEFFLPGDWRNELNLWVKDNCPSPDDFVKKKFGMARMLEALSIDLVERKKHGLTRMMIQEGIRHCGKTGECQEHKKTKERRYVGHYCNHRSYHIPCALRYRAGQGIELKNQYSEIARACDLWGYYSWVFTLSEGVRGWIDRNPEDARAFLSDCRRGVCRTIKAVFGLTTKTRGIQPGFSILYHPASSGNPFEQKSHFHVLALPLLVNRKTGEKKKFDKMISHAGVKRIFKRELDRVLSKWGLDLLIEPAYVVNLAWIDRDLESSVIHAFRYNNRSQAEDVLKRVQQISVDLDRFVCVLHDKEREVFVPTLKTRAEILDALERVMNPAIQIRMSYGYMRTLEQYADLLGVELDVEQLDENWEKLFDIEIIRLWNPAYDAKLGKVRGHLVLLIRRKGTWETIATLRPDELGGERSCMADRKIYRAKGGGNV